MFQMAFEETVTLLRLKSLFVSKVTCVWTCRGTQGNNYFRKKSRMKTAGATRRQVLFVLTNLTKTWQWDECGVIASTSCRLPGSYFLKAGQCFWIVYGLTRLESRTKAGYNPQELGPFG
jgi:hypothetical protein